MKLNDEQLHAKLPIGNNEKILAVIKHHWFAVASIYIGAGALCFLLLGALLLVVSSQSTLQLSDTAITVVVLFVVVFIAIIAVFSLVPAWIRKQESLVLTEEALLQLNKPSLFSSNVSQTNLAHIADVTVRQNTLGTMLGFGNLMVETPGEQNNYIFTVVAKPHEMAKKIIEAHENYAAALESGQIQTTLGARPAVPGTAWRESAQYPQTPPQTAVPQANPEPQLQPQSNDPNHNTPPPAPTA